MVSQAQTGGSFRQIGKLEIKFRGYAMSEEEYKMLESQEDYEALKFIEGMTTESLEVMREDIDKYLNESKKEEEKELAKGKASKPLLDSLFSFGSSGGEGSGTNLLADIQRFDEGSKIKRTKELVRRTIMDKIFTVYDIFKKAHRLLSFSYPPDLTPPTRPK
jgi:hypothetical protein